jgi:hypothetical protein
VIGLTIKTTFTNSQQGEAEQDRPEVTVLIDLSIFVPVTLGTDGTSVENVPMCSMDCCNIPPKSSSSNIRRKSGSSLICFINVLRGFDRIECDFVPLLLLLLIMVDREATSWDWFLLVGDFFMELQLATRNLAINLL